MSKKKIIEGFNMYKFILKIIAAVFLIAFAVLLFIEQDKAKFMLLLITGGVTALSGLIRLISLIKSERSKEAKLITLGETIIHVLLGGYLVAAAILFNDDPNTKLSNINIEYYGVFLAVILYTKAVSYFWQTVLYKVKTTKFMFWLHIVFVTISVLFAAFSNKVGAKEIVIAIAVVAILCALLIGGEAAGGYFKYRKSLAKTEKKESKKEKEEPVVEVPAIDEDKIIEEIDPNIIPVEDETNDTSIVS